MPATWAVLLCYVEAGYSVFMPSSAAPNFDSLALARQIIDLNVEVNREVEAKRYERAAALRDQRETLVRQLNDFGNPIVAQNVKIALRSGLTRAPVLSFLEQAESAVDLQLFQLISTATLPPRWLVHNGGGSCRATIAKRLRIDSLDSPYFQSQLPVFSSATLARATHPMEWLTAAIRETARATSPVVWIVQEPAYLAEHGLLDVVMQVLRVASTQFVVCLRERDAVFDSRFAEIPGVTVMRA
jgi:hypothetical protein